MLYIEKLYLNILFINSKKRCKKSQFCILAFFNSVILVNFLINFFLHVSVFLFVPLFFSF